MSKILIKFLLLVMVGYGSWFFLYEFILKPEGTLDHWLTESVTKGISRLLHYFNGYDSYYVFSLKPGETYLFIKPQFDPVVRVGASCNGLELLALFTLFILCYPGNWLYKVVFITAGNFLIHGLNILRNYWLTLLAYNQSPHYQLFHRYIFIFMVYGFIFLLWMLWASYLSKLTLNREKK